MTFPFIRRSLYETVIEVHTEFQDALRDAKIEAQKERDIAIVERDASEAAQGKLREELAEMTRDRDMAENQHDNLAKERDALKQQNKPLHDLLIERGAVLTRIHREKEKTEEDRDKLNGQLIMREERLTGMKLEIEALSLKQTDLQERAARWQAKAESLADTIHKARTALGEDGEGL